MNDQSVVFGIERNTSQRAFRRDPCEKLCDHGHHLIAVSLLYHWCRFLRTEPSTPRVRVL